MQTTVTFQEYSSGLWYQSVLCSYLGLRQEEEEEPLLMTMMMTLLPMFSALVFLPVGAFVGR